jgi:hypothetical protein
MLAAFQEITDAAESFVNRSPRSKRLETQRQALLDAIRRAQLVLSLARQPLSSSVSHPPKARPAENAKDSAPKRRKRQQ